MDKDFNKNFVKPTDKNFIYDKKVDFSKGRKIEDEWDWFYIFITINYSFF